MNLRAAACLGFLAVSGGICVVATQVPDSRFRSGVAVVEVTMLGHDETGRSIRDLRLDGLTVLENGAAPRIVAFERISIPPPVRTPGEDILRIVAAHSPTERAERRVPFEIVKSGS